MPSCGGFRSVCFGLILAGCSEGTSTGGGGDGTVGDPCVVASDCDTFVCLTGVCRQPCVSDSDCDIFTEHCEVGACLEGSNIECGNGRVDIMEDCDDGNRGSNDGCDTNCNVEPDYDCSSGVCRCIAGYQDADADGVCSPTCEFLNWVGCGGNGTCGINNGVATCFCDAGFQDGDNDGVCTPDCAAVIPGDCGAEGTCDDSSGTPTCACNMGYASFGDTTCEAATCAALGNCGMNGLCVENMGQAARCQCAGGFQDNDDSGTCEPDCATAIPGNCGSFGSCDDSSGFALCNCGSNYQDNAGTGVCELDCATHMAASPTGDCGNGTCDDSMGAAVCVCNGISFGTYCDECRVHVDASSTAMTPDGLSWATAFPDLHDGIAAAGPDAPASLGCEVWVAAGTYRPAGPAGDRDARYDLTDYVQLYGSFAGTETTMAQRNSTLPSPPTATSRPTSIISGDLNGDDGMGAVYRIENTNQLMTMDDNCVVDGFEIRDSNLTSSGTNKGGGIAAVGDTNAVISNNLFEANFTRGGGGAVGIANSTLIMEYNLIVANNTAGTVFNNGPGGGAVHVQNVSGPEVTIRYNVFDSNTSDDGGGMFIRGSGPAVYGNVFINNDTGSRSGGAIYINGAGAPVLHDNLFVGNNARNGGGIYIAGDAQVALKHNTFVNNTASLQHGALSVGPDVIVLLANSIVWGNTPTTDQAALRAMGIGTFQVEFSDIEGGWVGPGSNNIDIDPAFTDPMMGDYTLTITSPAVDTGSDLPAHTTASDLLGNPRVDIMSQGTMGTLADMGCYEYTP